MPNTLTTLNNMLSGGSSYTVYREFEYDYFHIIKAIMDDPRLVESANCQTTEQKQRLGYLMQCALWRMPSSDGRRWLQNIMFDVLRNIEDKITPINIWVGHDEKVLYDGCESAYRWKIMNPINYSRLRQFFEHGVW